MIAEWLHHVTLHFPIVMTFALAGLGAWTMREESERTVSFIRWAGWATFALTTVAVVAGILSAPGWLGGDGPKVLSDHRDLGVTAWFVVGLAAWGYDHGVRHSDREFRLFGVAIWAVASFAVIGAGHWGGVGQYPELSPF